MLERLTARENEVARFVVSGLSNKHIARKIGLTEGTVKSHLHSTYLKLGIPNRTALAILMMQAAGNGSSE